MERWYDDIDLDDLHDSDNELPLSSIANFDPLIYNTSVIAKINMYKNEPPPLNNMGPLINNLDNELPHSSIINPCLSVDNNCNTAATKRKTLKYWSSYMDDIEPDTINSLDNELPLSSIINPCFLIDNKCNTTAIKKKTPKYWSSYMDDMEPDSMNSLDNELPLSSITNANFPFIDAPMPNKIPANNQDQNFETSKISKDLEKNYECNICEKKFPTRSLIIEHFKSSDSLCFPASTKEIEFNNNRYYYDNTLKLSVDTSILENSNNYVIIESQCKNCRTKIKNQNNMPINKCRVLCDKKNNMVRPRSSNKNYDRHKKRYQITRNSTSNGSKTLITLHKYYKCFLCKNKFSDINIFKSHKKSHRESRCQLCPEKSKNIYALQRHYKNIHKINKPFECNICHLTFLHSSSVYRHKKTHFMLNNKLDLEFNENNVKITDYKFINGKIECALCMKTFDQQKFYSHILSAHY